MKITISKDFTNADEAVAFVQTLLTPVDVNVVTPAARDVKVRKSRSDAGQNRAPYNTKAKSNGGQAASGPDAAGDSAPVVSEAPVSPTSTAPVDLMAEIKRQVAPTKEEAHATLKRMGAVKGLGTPACIEFLKDFGVQRFSDLPADKYPLFVEQALVKIAEAETA
jgi:hypothetical protein